MKKKTQYNLVTTVAMLLMVAILWVNGVNAVYTGNASILNLKTNFSDGKIPNWLHVTGGEISGGKLLIHAYGKAITNKTSVVNINGSAVSLLFSNIHPKKVVVNWFNVNISIPNKVYTSLAIGGGYYDIGVAFYNGKAPNNYAVLYISITKNNNEYEIYLKLAEIYNGNIQDSELWSKETGRVIDYFNLNISYIHTVEGNSSSIIANINTDVEGINTNESAFLEHINIPYGDLVYKVTSWGMNGAYLYVTYIDDMIAYLKSGNSTAGGNGTGSGNNNTGLPKLGNLVGNSPVAIILVILVIAMAVIIVLYKRLNLS